MLPDQLAHALAGDGGDPVAVEVDVGLGEVGARPDDQPGPVEQVGLVLPQLVEEDPLLLGGRVGREGREVEQEHEHPRPLHVAQEPVPEPAPVGWRPR